MQEPGAKLRSVADDLYARALESALDDVLRALRVEAPAGEERLQMQPILVSTSARAGTPTAASSQALLRAVLLEEEQER